MRRGFNVWVESPNRLHRSAISDADRSRSSKCAGLGPWFAFGSPRRFPMRHVRTGGTTDETYRGIYSEHSVTVMLTRAPRG